MAQNSKIEWTHHTANLWWGCTKVHEGCDNCYAETLSKRFGDNVWGKDAPRREIKSVWSDLNKFQSQALKANEIHRVFVGSMMDIFEKPMPLVDSNGNPSLNADTGVLRNQLFQFIDKGFYNNLMFLLLTKRPSNINKMIPESWIPNPPENVMFGTSPATQKTADTLIPQLLKVNGKRFLSIEPQIEPIRISQYLLKGGIHWVIQGGESGHNKRPFELHWAYNLKVQCLAHNVAYFFKQIDKVRPVPEELARTRQFPECHNFLIKSQHT